MELFTLWIEILLPILTIAIPVFATVYTVNSRIKNDKMESHKPYLVLESIKDLNKLDKSKYYLTFLGRNYVRRNLKVETNVLEKIGSDSEIYVDISLRNIGYGVASDIKFYNLLTGEEFHGNQENLKNMNQKLFTTLDVGTNEIKTVQVKVVNFIEDGEIKEEDHNRILCVYKDLNNNVYSLIITINMKEQNHYDFFAYQPTSRSYMKWIRQNKKEFKKIYKTYTSL